MKKTFCLVALYVGLIFLPYCGICYAADYTVNINTANKEQLESLKGIGSKKAESILLDRKEKGNFHSVSELSRVKGLGDNFIKRLMENNPGKIGVGDLKEPLPAIKNNRIK